MVKIGTLETGARFVAGGLVWTVVERAEDGEVCAESKEKGGCWWRADDEVETAGEGA